MNVGFIATFCFQHICHLIVGGSIRTMNAWTWPEPYDLGIRYFTGVGTLANIWRSTGFGLKLRDVVETLFGIDVCHRCFRQIPGRPLKGRWGAIDAIEKSITRARHYIGAAFTAAIGKGKTKKRKTRDDDDDDGYQAKMTTWRGHAVTCANSAIFLAMCIISMVAKGPLIHFQCWAQKHVKLQSNQQAVAARQGTCHFGPTPLSMLVCGIADELWASINELGVEIAGGR